MSRASVDMLDKIGLAERLGLATTAALFGDASERLHSTSVLRYPILKDQWNYSGSPKVCKSRMLTEIAKANLPSELEQLPNALIVPLGRAVEDQAGRDLPAGRIAWETTPCMTPSLTVQFARRGLYRKSPYLWT